MAVSLKPVQAAFEADTTVLGRSSKNMRSRAVFPVEVPAELAKTAMQMKFVRLAEGVLQKGLRI